MLTNASVDVQWAVIRKNSAFLRRQRGIPKHFSSEPFNLKNINSIRFNGLVHPKAIDVRMAPDGKGVQLVTKSKRKASRPAHATAITVLRKGSRKALKSVRAVAKHYRPGQTMLAQRRASQMLRALKPKTAARRGAKKTHGGKSE